MLSMSPRLVFIVLVGAYLASAWTSGGNIGASSGCVNSDCLVSASSSLLSVVIAVALALFIARYRQVAVTLDSAKVVGLWRRFGAFVIDFAAVLLVVAPVAALPLLIVESHYTGAFHWSFERRFARSTDMVTLMPGIVAAFAGLLLYFYLHPRLGRPTVGAYVLGYRVMASSDTQSAPNWAMRTVCSFLGLCMWPVTVILALRTPQKVCWWDSVAGTQAIRVRLAESTGNNGPAVQDPGRG